MKLILVFSIFGFLVSTTLVSQAATDATDATSDVGSTPSTQANTNSQGHEFVVPPATNSDVVYRVDRSTGEVGACVFSAKGPTIWNTTFSRRRRCGASTSRGLRVHPFKFGDGQRPFSRQSKHGRDECLLRLK